MMRESISHDEEPPANSPAAGCRRCCTAVGNISTSTYGSGGILAVGLCYHYNICCWFHVLLVLLRFARAATALWGALLGGCVVCLARLNTAACVFPPRRQWQKLKKKSKTSNFEMFVIARRNSFKYVQGKPYQPNKQ